MPSLWAEELQSQSWLPRTCVCEFRGLTCTGKTVVEPGLAETDSDPAGPPSRYDVGAATGPC